MAKVIRSTYPKEFSIGLLILIFALSFFLSTQVFEVTWSQLMEGGTNVYIGMFLISIAVLIMVLILWEEFLFPIQIKPAEDGIIFRNHRTKLKTQLFIYFLIPIIFVFVYLNYDVRATRFTIWAIVCCLLPVVLKLLSGINNYNDFLKLTLNSIEYKNNKETGLFALRDIQQITLVRDQRTVLHKIEVKTSSSPITIDLDEMELEAFLDSIDKYVSEHYKSLIKETKVSN